MAKRYTCRSCGQQAWYGRACPACKEWACPNCDDVLEQATWAPDIIWCERCGDNYAVVLAELRDGDWAIVGLGEEE